ncbi:MAG: DUF4364 family protein [Clostridiales bacterium]|nr:DUF4364 family protein [Clostridiales bacterium]
MDRFGFIHEKLEIKILILFVLSRLPHPVGLSDLTDMVMCDDGITYFEFIQALSELLETEHVNEEDDLYTISLKGIKNGSITESSLPYSVRHKAERNIMRLSRILNRSAMIKTDSVPRKEGGYIVHLSLADGIGEMISLSVLAGNEGQAKDMEKHFYKNAEGLYNEIMRLLLDE